ncbi:hypothetical protein [Thalassobius vesicularis]|nr:hypothetical protein [Thalassobius vesicularis]
MRAEKKTVLGVDAPPPRLTPWALGLIAGALALPVAVILWTLEALQ